MRTAAFLHDEINRVRDSEAASLATSALGGLLPEREARWRIAALLRGSGIVEQVAHGRRLRHQETDDLIDGLYCLADAMIVGVDRPANLDLEQLAGGASFCGWARHFLSSRQACTTVQRGSWARSRREVLAIDDTDGAFVAQPLTDLADSRLDEDTAETSIERFAERAKGLRPCGRAHLTAHTLATAFQLPRPRRAVDAEDREQMLALVERDPHAVHESLRCWLATPGLEPCGPAALFAEWTRTEVHSLLSLQPVVSQALAVAALTPVPPPQTQHMVELRHRLERSGSRPPAVKPLTDAFAALVAETTSSEFDTHRPTELKPPEDRAADRAHFEDVVRRILARGWTRLGSTPGEVEAHLYSLLDQVRYGAPRPAAA